MSKKLVPNYEVKLLMKPEVVLVKDSNGNLTTELKKEILEEFEIKLKKKPVQNMAIQFIDTSDQAIQKSGWNLRVRKTEGDDTFGLTWKKRVKINVNAHPEPAKNIDVAVDEASAQGFEAGTDWEAQVETGYKAQTLSISFSDEKNVSAKDHPGMDLLDDKNSCKFLTDLAPSHFQNWSTVSTQESGSGGPLDKAIVYGPVQAKRYQGKWNDNKLYIEVWPIRVSKTDSKMEQVVEASFKVDETKDAMDGRDKLAKYLDKKGWFKAEDSLKTAMIMERYGATS